MESYRENGKVKQRIIQHLGPADALAVATDTAPAPAPTPPAPPADPAWPVGARVWFKYIDAPYRATITEWDGKYYSLDFDDPNFKGDICRQGRVLPDRIIGRVFKVGDRVKFIDCQGGEMYGTVIQGTTQSEACPWPKRRRASRELVEIPYEVPATVTVKYNWLTQTLVTTMPVSRVWYPLTSPPDCLQLAGHGKDMSRVQLPLWIS